MRREGKTMFRCWRRVDQPGLELVRIESMPDAVTATSTLIDGGVAPFSMRYVWSLDSDWRTRSLHIERSSVDDGSLTIEREGDADWKVDGKHAPHLSGCVELDLSATPFCNSLAIRRLGESGELRVAWIDAAKLSVAPSRQRYEKFDGRNWRYVDMDIAYGFEAGLQLDTNGLVERYEGLFEALN
jgi:hypothetical protein